MSSLLYMIWSWSGVALLLSDMCYCHQLGMISFIKFLLSFAFSCCNADWAKYHVFAAGFKLALDFNICDWPFVGSCLGCFSLVMTSSVFLGIWFFFCCFADHYLSGFFHIARHLAAKFGTRLAAFSVYVFFAMGGWFISWSDAAFSIIFCNLLFSSDGDD
jgi:hypothetical protein